ncbi:MAG TPA: tetratricopeptide repeat protein [Candidatus Acidoferrum sp.]|nr:tetratricopeptide repeat protein [Candidatus Acidoferrum sp.]
MLLLLTTASLLGAAAPSQDRPPDWHAEVRKLVEAHEWESAMKIVDRKVALAPQDMDVRAWRARILAWSGRLAEAEKEYLEILKFTRNDPDNWMGLASVYLREGKPTDALRALDRAVEIDPKRADLRAARGRALRATGERHEARTEFQNALNLDPTSVEGRAGMISVRDELKHELRFGQDNDLFNFTSANRDGWVSLVSQWTPHWGTSLAGSYYDRSGIRAGKFSGAVTGRLHRWGALTAGGSAGHDNGVIPKSEAFFDFDHGWKVSETKFLRGMEFVYGQHWYWYRTSRIFTLNETSIVELPRNFALTLGATGVRSAFPGAGEEWQPAGMARLRFPLGNWGEKRLSGNILFAVGSEDFAQIDQIGRFAAQTYGGGLRFQVNARQDITGYGSYQKRTQGGTDTSFGLSYGIHF